MKLKIDEINLEEGMPSSDEALDILKDKITRCKKNKIHCLYIIHGYGSSGIGGTIRVKIRKWLSAQVRSMKIKCMVFGEDFNIVNDDPRRLYEKYEGLENLLCCCNHGVTVIEL